MIAGVRVPEPARRIRAPAPEPRARGPGPADVEGWAAFAAGPAALEATFTARPAGLAATFGAGPAALEATFAAALPAGAAALGTAVRGGGGPRIGPSDLLALAPAIADVEPAPLDAQLRAVLGPVVGADLSRLPVRADAASQATLEAAGAAAAVVDGAVLLPAGTDSLATPEAARLLLSAVTRALEGVEGPVDPAAPLEDPVQAEASPVPPAPEAPAGPAPAEAAPPAPEPEVPAAPAEPVAEQAPAAPAEPAPPAGAPAEAEAEAAPVELLMPPAPAAPGPEQQARMATVASGAGRAARTATDLPSAAETTGEARAAVTEPTAETAARARAELAQELGERPAPSPEIVALCERIRTAIREKRPVDEDELTSADPRAAAAEAGAGLNAAVEGEAQRVQDGYQELNQPPEGTPQLDPQPLAPPAADVPDPGVGAPSAAPDAIPESDLSLDADRAQVDQQVQDARIERRTTEPLSGPPFSTVREGQAELGELAATRPAELAAQQQQALAQAEADMGALQAQALDALRTSRAATVTGVSAGQQGMVGSEEQTRAQVSAEAQRIFDEAATQVNALLQPLAGQAIARWDAGVAIVASEFRASLDRVQAWIDERHEGVGGALVGLYDAVAGLPDWVIDEYDRAERAFGDGVCELLTEISRDVNAVTAAAQAVIDNARTRIDALFADLPEGLRAWAEGERARFQDQLDGLSRRVTDAQTSFVRDVSQRAVSAVSEVQAEVERVRSEARGVIGRIADAIEAFLDDPIRAIIDGLLNLVGIPPPAFWALVERIRQVISDIADDPERFINNLVEALRLGFEGFFERFGQHVINGFWEWLFSGLGSVGVRMPADTSLRSLVTFALEVMGITWPRIREVLVRHIGEENVELIERAWEIVSTLIEQGPEGVFNMIRDRLDPQRILDEILTAAIDYLIEALIRQVTIRVVALLNPVGAIAQAIELIYKVLRWIFENAARIFRLVETVVNGIADIIAGNLGAMAAAVERALASLVPIVIDFLAGLLGLGDLPDRIADVIRRLQAWVLGIVDTVVGWLVRQARALLAAVGLGGEEEEEAEEGAEDTELGAEVRFSADGEAHRMWIEVTAEDAVPMVASQPVRVHERLTQWETEAAERFADDPDGRTQATTLLETARSLLAEMDAAADALAEAYANAEPDSELPSDAAVEQRQLALSRALRELYELFVGPSVAALLEGIGNALPAHGRSRAQDRLESWWDRMAGIQVGNRPEDPPLWQSALTIAGTDTTAVAYTGQATVHEQLLPYFTAAPGERDATRPAFAHYAFAQMDATHTVRRAFHEALGDEVAQALKDAAAPVLASATHVDDTYLNRLRSRVADIAYVWTPTGGRFVLPTERIPDHTRFRPLDMTFEQNGAVIRYRTVTGQTYVVTRDPAEGLTHTVEGLGLRLMSGRGVTEDSPWFTSGQGFNRAHLIANEFGGSGYASGANLATTSEHYNQRVMRDAERAIGRGIVAHALSRGVADDAVTFNLTVTVTFGALLDATVLAKVKEQTWFPEDAGQDLDAEIRAKIDAGEVHPDLRRVLSVVYVWQPVNPPGPARTIRIGEDLWLLAE